MTSSSPQRLGAWGMSLCIVGVPLVMQSVSYMSVTVDIETGNLVCRSFSKCSNGSRNVEDDS